MNDGVEAQVSVFIKGFYSFCVHVWGKRHNKIRHFSLKRVDVHTVAYFLMRFCHTKHQDIGNNRDFRKGLLKWILIRS